MKLQIARRRPHPSLFSCIPLIAIYTLILIHAVSFFATAIPIAINQFNHSADRIHNVNFFNITLSTPPPVSTLNTQYLIKFYNNLLTSSTITRVYYDIFPLSTMYNRNDQICVAIDDSTDITMTMAIFTERFTDEQFSVIASTTVLLQMSLNTSSTSLRDLYRFSCTLPYRHKIPPYLEICDISSSSSSECRDLTIHSLIAGSNAEEQNLHYNNLITSSFLDITFTNKSTAITNLQESTGNPGTPRSLPLLNPFPSLTYTIQSPSHTTNFLFAAPKPIYHDSYIDQQTSFTSFFSSDSLNYTDIIANIPTSVSAIIPPLLSSCLPPIILTQLTSQIMVLRQCGVLDVYLNEIRPTLYSSLLNNINTIETSTYSYDKIYSLSRCANLPSQLSIPLRDSPLPHHAPYDHHKFFSIPSAPLHTSQGQPTIINLKLFIPPELLYPSVHTLHLSPDPTAPRSVATIVLTTTLPSDSITAISVPHPLWLYYPVTDPRTYKTNIIILPPIFDSNTSVFAKNDVYPLSLSLDHSQLYQNIDFNITLQHSLFTEYNTVYNYNMWNNIVFPGGDSSMNPTQIKFNVLCQNSLEHYHTSLIPPSSRQYPVAVSTSVPNNPGSSILLQKSPFLSIFQNIAVNVVYPRIYPNTLVYMNHLIKNPLESVTFLGFSLNITITMNIMDLRNYNNDAGLTSFAILFDTHHSNLHTLPQICTVSLSESGVTVPANEPPLTMILCSQTNRILPQFRALCDGVVIFRPQRANLDLLEGDTVEYTITCLFAKPTLYEFTPNMGNITVSLYHIDSHTIITLAQFPPHDNLMFSFNTTTGTIDHFSINFDEIPVLDEDSHSTDIFIDENNDDLLFADASYIEIINSSNNTLNIKNNQMDHNLFSDTFMSSRIPNVSPLSPNLAASYQFHYTNYSVLLIPSNSTPLSQEKWIYSHQITLSIDDAHSILTNNLINFCYEVASNYFNIINNLSGSPRVKRAFAPVFLANLTGNATPNFPSTAQINNMLENAYGSSYSIVNYGLHECYSSHSTASDGIPFWDYSLNLPQNQNNGVILYTITVVTNTDLYSPLTPQTNNFTGIYTDIITHMTHSYGYIMKSLLVTKSDENVLVLPSCDPIYRLQIYLTHQLEHYNDITYQYTFISPNSNGADTFSILFGTSINFDQNSPPSFSTLNYIDLSDCNIQYDHKSLCIRNDQCRSGYHCHFLPTWLNPSYFSAILQYPDSSILFPSLALTNGHCIPHTISNNTYDASQFVDDNHYEWMGETIDTGLLVRPEDAKVACKCGDCSVIFARYVCFNSKLQVIAQNEAEHCDLSIKPPSLVYKTVYVDCCPENTVLYGPQCNLSPVLRNVTVTHITYIQPQSTATPTTPVIYSTPIDIPSEEEVYMLTTIHSSTSILTVNWEYVGGPSTLVNIYLTMQSLQVFLTTQPAQLQTYNLTLNLIVPNLQLSQITLGLISPQQFQAQYQVTRNLFDQTSSTSGHTNRSVVNVTDPDQFTSDGSLPFTASTQKFNIMASCLNYISGSDLCAPHGICDVTLTGQCDCDEQTFASGTFCQYTPCDSLNCTKFGSYGCMNGPVTIFAPHNTAVYFDEDFSFDDIASTIAVYHDHDYLMMGSNASIPLTDIDDSSIEGYYQFYPDQASSNFHLYYIFLNNVNNINNVVSERYNSPLFSHFLDFTDDLIHAQCVCKPGFTGPTCNMPSRSNICLSQNSININTVLKDIDVSKNTINNYDDDLIVPLSPQSSPNFSILQNNSSAIQLCTRGTPLDSFGNCGTSCICPNYYISTPEDLDTNPIACTKCQLRSHCNNTIDYTEYETEFGVLFNLTLNNGTSNSPPFTPHPVLSPLSSVTTRGLHNNRCTSCICSPGFVGEWCQCKLVFANLIFAQNPEYTAFLPRSYDFTGISESFSTSGSSYSMMSFISDTLKIFSHTTDSTISNSAKTNVIRARQFQKQLEKELASLFNLPYFQTDNNMPDLHNFRPNSIFINRLIEFKDTLYYQQATASNTKADDTSSEHYHRDILRPLDVSTNQWYHQITKMTVVIPPTALMVNIGIYTNCHDVAQSTLDLTNASTFNLNLHLNSTSTLRTDDAYFRFGVIEKWINHYIALQASDRDSNLVSIDEFNAYSIPSTLTLQSTPLTETRPIAVNNIKRFLNSEPVQTSGGLLAILPLYDPICPVQYKNPHNLDVNNGNSSSEAPLTSNLTFHSALTEYHVYTRVDGYESDVPLLRCPYGEFGFSEKLNDAARLTLSNLVALVVCMTFLTIIPM